MSSTPKVALVTGGSARLGLAIAQRLHADNYNLIIHYRHQRAAAEALVASFNRQRKQCALAVQADLEQAPALQTLTEQTLAPWGRLDLLVNNASSFYSTPLAQSRLSDWEQLMGSNVKAPYFLVQALREALIASQGNVINMLDIYAHRPLANHSLYCMSKAALAMMTQALALELAPQVRVNAVAPGAILWPATGHADTTHQQRILAKIPLQQCGTPADIAATVAFLAHSPYITGQIISVDGGRSLNI